MSLSSSRSDMQMENVSMIDSQPLNHKNDPIVSVSQDYQSKLPSSYLSLSIGDNQQSDWLNHPHSFFSQRPLNMDLEHETGDRIRLITHDSSRGYPKPRSIISRKKRSKKVLNRTAKEKQRKRKIQKRARVPKKTISIREKDHDLGFKTRQRVLSKRKKKSLNQSLRLNKRSVSKINKKKSSLSNSNARKPSMMNRMRTSPSPSSVIRLTDQVNSDTLSNRLKQPVQTSVLQSKIIQLLHENKNLFTTPGYQLTRNNISSTPVKKSSSKNTLRSSKVNVGSLGPSKSKKNKQLNRRITKLKINSPMPTNFKKKASQRPKRRAIRRKIKRPACTSKTLITMGMSNDKRMKSIEMQPKMPSSLFSFKDNLTKKSSAMPLMNNCAQLTSKNNNERVLRSQRQGKSFISKGKSTKK